MKDSFDINIVVAQVAAMHLNNLFDRSVFDISCISDAARCLGVSPHNETYNILSTLQCTQFRSIPLDKRNLADLVLYCLRNPSSLAFNEKFIVVC